MEFLDIMKSEDLIKPKNSIAYILNSHSSFAENQSFHPVFKLTENIYTTETNNFFERFHSPESPQKSATPARPTSQTPIPMKFYRDPKKNKQRKEDIFINPSAFYLSRKPIAFSKNSRDKQRRKNYSLDIPTARSSHRKDVNYPLNSPYKLPKVSPPNLFPLDCLKSISPSPAPSRNQQTKEMQCEVLSQLAEFCESVREEPKPSITKEQRLLNRYSEQMNWITDVIQSYGEYDHRILKELFKYSSDSRNDLESERANIVHLMKIGVFDPNKNVVKLKTRIKKKKER